MYLKILTYVLHMFLFERARQDKIGYEFVRMHKHNCTPLKSICTNKHIPIRGLSMFIHTVPWYVLINT